MEARAARGSDQACRRVSDARGEIVQNKRTHTPGPWTCDSQAVDEPQQGESGTIYEYNVHEGPRLVVSTYDQEDARLIAAAPDLLEMLGKALASMEYVRKAMPLDRKDHDEYLVISEAITQARAAIAKAEGR